MNNFLDTFSLDDLPKREDQSFEYKGGNTPFENLKGDKLPKAASAFWNSGGGAIFLGVGDDGVVDGGLPLLKGTEDIRDWLDKTVSNFTPNAKYFIRIYESADAPGHNISPGRCVAGIYFCRCPTAPIMGPKSKYYIRAGARSEPATAFIVEALFANRQTAIPAIVHSFRLKPNDDDTVQLGIIGINDAPALNVMIDFEPRPPRFEGPTSPLPLLMPVVTRESPFFFDYTFWYDDTEHVDVNVQLHVTYDDATGANHSYSAELDVKRSTSPMVAQGANSLTRRLKDISTSIENLRKC